MICVLEAFNQKQAGEVGNRTPAAGAKKPPGAPHGTICGNPRARGCLHTRTHADTPFSRFVAVRRAYYVQQLRAQVACAGLRMRMSVICSRTRTSYAVPIAH